MPRRTAKLGVEETDALVYASVSVARLLTEVIPKEVLGRVLLDECEAGSFLSPADDIKMPFVVDLCPFVEHVLFDTATYPLRFFKYVCTAMPNLTSISIRSKSGIVSGHTFSHMAKLSETLEAIDCTELVAVVPDAGRYFSQFKQLRRLGYRCVNPAEDIPMLRAELPLLQRLDAPLLNLTERFGTGAETDSAGAGEAVASDCSITAGFTDLRRLKVSLSLPGRAAQPPRCLQSLSSLTALELTLHLCDIGELSAPTPAFWIKLCRQMPRLVSLTLAAEWSGDLSPLMVGLRLFCPHLQHLKIHHYYFQEGAQYGLIGLLADAAPWNALQKSTGVPTNDVIEWLGDDCGGVVPVPDRRPGAAAVEEWFNNAPPIELRSLTIFNTSCDVRQPGFKAQRIIDGFASLLMARSSRRLTAIHLGKDASSWYLVLPIARLLAAIPFARCLKIVDLGGVCIEGATYFEVAVAVSDSTHPLNPNATARIEQLNLFSPGIHSTVPDTTLSARRTWLATLSQNAHRAASRDSGSSGNSGENHHTVSPAGGDGGAEDAAAASCSLSSTAEVMVQAGGFPIMSQSMRRIQASTCCCEDADFRSMIAGCPKLEVIGVACTGADPSHLVPPGRALEIVRSGFVVSDHLRHAVVLTYWPVRGLGAGIRLSLTVAGVDFDNKMLTSHEDVGAAEAATGHPLYNTPTLTTEDGQVITQSGAILRHIAREYNLAGKNATERARVDEVLENIVDFRKELLKYTYADSAERAAELKPSLLSETVPYYFGGLDKYMAKNGTAFVASNEVTVADCLLFTDLDNHAILLEQPVAEALAAFPALLKLLLCMPQVQQYQAHPAMGQLKANGPGASWSPMVVPQ